MSLRSQLGRARGTVLRSFYRRTAPLGCFGPIVSFTFDDVPRTACWAGGAILEKFGARGTFYISAGLQNTTGELGDLFVESDLLGLVEKGHEIGSHTFHHSSSRAVTLSEFKGDVQDGSKALEHLLGRSSGNFAYPFGHVTLGTKKALAQCVTSARSIMPGFNGPEIDLNLLRANRLYGDLDAAGRVTDLIAQNTKLQRWLIFYTHDVRPAPSAYGCTPALLEFAVSHAGGGGSRIMTVGEVLSQIGTQAEAGRPASPELVS